MLGLDGILGVKGVQAFVWSIRKKSSRRLDIEESKERNKKKKRHV